MIGKGDLVNGLYVYKLSPSQLQDNVPADSDVVASSHVNSNSSLSCHDQYNKVFADVWHRKLGHVSDTIFRFISNKVPFTIPTSYTTHSCDICPLSKQKRLSFTSNNHVASEIFDLVHCYV